MTLNSAREQATARRLAILTLLVIANSAYAIAPSMIGLEAAGIELWYVVGWILVPMAAGAAAWRAAAKSDGSARTAWRSFSFGACSWIAATVVWASYGWLGAELPFPSLADAFYVGSNVLFVYGMYHYCLAGSGGGRLQVTNFALAVSSVVAIGLLVYLPVLLESEMGWLGATIVFLYPALWLGTCAFAFICYSLHAPPQRSFPLLLLVAAAAAHAFADFFYGFDVLNEVYAAGTFYDVFWNVTFSFMTWAALEHRPARVGHLRRAERAGGTGHPGEPLVPALSVAAILSAGVVTEWHQLGTPIVPALVLPVVIGFGALLAIRERSLFASERSHRAKAEESARRLAESEKRLSRVLASTTCCVLVLDTGWRPTFANPNAIRLLFPDRPFLGITIWELFPGLVRSEIAAQYRMAMQRQLPVEFETYYKPLDSWFEVNAVPSPDNLTIFFRDITERRRLRDELVRLAQHDPLTGLANRTLFDERLASGLQSDRRQSGLNLLMIDLNDFKAVNDRFGHLAGDSLVQQFANRLTSLVRQGDTVARFGGDEFAIIQPGPVEPGDSAAIARRIDDSLLTPFDVHGSQVTLEVSIGIALAPMHGNRPEELLRNADLALYRAKARKGRGPNYCVFDPEVDQPAQPGAVQLHEAPRAPGSLHSVQKKFAPDLDALDPAIGDDVGGCVGLGQSGR